MFHSLATDWHWYIGEVYVLMHVNPLIRYICFLT